ncbi:MAG: CDP-alcohol phosphatidyltransferase family protein [Promethearchaeia archaeon]
MLLAAGEAKWALGGLAIAAVSDALDGFIARTVSVGLRLGSLASLCAPW